MVANTLPPTEPIFTFDDPTSTLPEDVRLRGTAEGLVVEDLDGKECQTLLWEDLREMLAFKQAEEDMMDELHLVFEKHTFIFECEDAFGVRGTCILFQKQFMKVPVVKVSETETPSDPYDEEELTKLLCYAPGQVFRLVLDGKSEICTVKSVDQQTGDHEVNIANESNEPEGMIAANNEPRRTTVNSLATKSHAPVNSTPFYKVGGKLFKTDNRDAPQLKTGMYTITSLELRYTATVMHFVEASAEVKESIDEQVTELVKDFTSVPLAIEHKFTKAVTFQLNEQTQSDHKDVVTEILSANRRNTFSKDFASLKKQYPNIESGLTEFSRKKKFYKVMFGKSRFYFYCF